MSEFKAYVFAALVAVLAGGIIGGLLIYGGNIWGGFFLIYLSSAIASVAVLWGFAVVFDKIGDNAARIEYLMEFLTDKLDEGEPKDNTPKGPGAQMSNVEIKSVITRYASETGDVDELAELLITKYPGLTKERVLECISEIEYDVHTSNFKK